MNRHRMETAARWRPDINAQQAAEREAELLAKVRRANEARPKERVFFVYDGTGMFMGDWPENIARSFVEDNPHWTYAEKTGA